MKRTKNQRIGHIKMVDFGDYQHHKAWRIGTSRYHLSVPKPGSGVGPTIQAGNHLFWVARLPQPAGRQ